MNSKKIIVITIVIFTVFIVGFIPTKFLVKWFFGGKTAEKETIPVSETKISSLPEPKVEKIENAPVEKEKIIFRNEEYEEKAKGKKEDFVKPHQQGVKPEPLKKLEDKLKVRLLDPMESKIFWNASNKNGDSSNIGVYRGIDGKALALYYKLGANGWAAIERSLDLDLAGAQGLRFACKTDGDAGWLILEISCKNEKLVERAWVKKEIEGSSWKIFTFLFPIDKIKQFRNKKADLIKFIVVSKDNRVKGRLVVDNLELID